MKAAIIVFPGTNREQDMAEALEAASGRKPAMVWHRDTDLPDADLIVVPGGFSYGDYLRAGAMAAHSPILRSVVAAAKNGTAVLGVCNGFQILVETGLLPDDAAKRRLCELSCQAGAAFVKTSTGFGYVKNDAGALVSTGATEHDIRLMRAACPSTVGVKASGGIRSYEDAAKFVELGATRLGTSGAKAIAAGEPNTGDY